MAASVPCPSASGAMERYAVCARTMGVATADSSVDDAVDALLRALRQLNADLCVPSPQAYGITRETWFNSIDTMARQALESGSPSNNPRIPTHQEICDLYTGVWA